MSAAGQDANVGTTPVREGYGFDETALTSWMEANVAGFTGPITVEQFKGGQSNPTYKLISPKRTYVLRRKPPGDLLKGAHAIEREARVLEALAVADFPVARVHGVCTDDSVIGTWFYVMDMVDGRIFWDAGLPDIPASERRSYFDAMNAAIAQLHSLNPAAIGLGDFGKPGNYFSRQITRWSRQYLADADAGRDPNMDFLLEWLPANLPVDHDDAISIVHGDFRIDNIIFHTTEPRILAVLDWELSTIGHALSDFAYHTMMYHMPSHIVAGLAGEDLVALNIPSEEEYLSAYCRRVGRADLRGYRFALAFNFFRLAAIFHGIKGRAIRGTASSEQAHQRGSAFPELARLAVSQARLVR